MKVLVTVSVQLFGVVIVDMEGESVTVLQDGEHSFFATQVLDQPQDPELAQQAANDSDVKNVAALRLVSRQRERIHRALAEAGVLVQEEMDLQSKAQGGAN